MKKILLTALLLLLAALAAASLADKGEMPVARYTGITQSAVFIRKERSTEAEQVGHINSGSKIQIVDYDPEWVTVVKGTEKDWVSGYVLRRTISDVKQLEGAELPYGATPAKYTATIAKDTYLYVEPDKNSEAFFTLTKGTKVAILGIEDGWARVIYWRLYGYFYMGDVTDLIPVYRARTAQTGDVIAAFISFYNMSEEEINLNRMENIRTACEYISITIDPGMTFSFDEIAGPYRGNRGYLQALSLFEGEVVPSSGGGVCQVSSTLYNVLIALPEGMEIIYRRAHGPAGASYLPHGVDAAVGSDSLNLIFKNTFEFPVVVETAVQDGVLYISFRKG